MRLTTYNLQLTKGFTLIELIMTIAIFTVLAGGVFVLVSSILANSSRQARLLSGSDSARKIAFQITNELRNAQSGANGAYSIGSPGNTELLFYSNADNQIDIERIRYFSQNGQLQRGIVKPSGTPPTYNLGTEVISTVLGDLANTSTPLFYYYDETYDGSADNYLVQPVSIPEVRFIRADLRVYLKGGIENQQIFRVTAGGTVRNLKTNLGN